MDGSSSSVSSMSHGGAKSSRRPKIIGGIIGGAVGLVLVLLCVHCGVLALRRRHRRQQSHNDAAYEDLEKAKQADAAAAARQERHAKYAKPANAKARARASPKNPKNLSVATNRLRSMGPFVESRPLPQEPRSAPSLPHQTPYVGNGIEHETAYLTRPAAPSSAAAAAYAGGAQPEVGARRAASFADTQLGSPRILQALGTPQPPAPRKARDLRPNSEDPFV